MLQGPIEGRILSFNDMVLIIISELFILISKLVSVELKTRCSDNLVKIAGM